MIFALVILYVVTLVYFPVTERFRNYASLIAIQGWLLLGIAIMRLHSVNVWELVFVVAETMIFKAIVVPRILFGIISRSKINRIAASGGSQFNSLMLSLAALVGSSVLTYYIADSTVNVVFFGVSLYAILSGLILITVRRRIFSHMIGFLVIENGVFLFAMAVGVEMPVLINVAILLDILITILMLGIFLSKLGTRAEKMDAEHLTKLKD